MMCGESSVDAYTKTVFRRGKRIDGGEKTGKTGIQTLSQRLQTRTTLLQIKQSRTTVHAAHHPLSIHS